MQLITIKSYQVKKSIIIPILFLIIGLILFLNPGGVIEFISYIFGGVFLTLGIGKIVADSKRNDKTTGDTFYSLIMIVLGLISIFFSPTIEFIFRLAIGVWILLNALSTISVGLNLQKTDKKNVVTLIFGFVLLAMSLYTIFVENIILSTIGIILIIYAVLEIVDYFYILGNSRE